MNMSALCVTSEICIHHFFYLQKYLCNSLVFIFNQFDLYLSGVNIKFGTFLFLLSEYCISFIFTSYLLSNLVTAIATIHHLIIIYIVTVIITIYQYRCFLRWTAATSDCMEPCTKLKYNRRRPKI